MSCAQGSNGVIELLIVERAIVQRSTGGSTGGWLDLGALLLVDVVFLVGVVGVEAQALYREITIKVRHYRCGRIEVLDALQVLEVLLQVGDVVFLLLLPHSLEDAFDVEAITELFLRALSERQYGGGAQVDKSLLRSLRFWLLVARRSDLARVAASGDRVVAWPSARPTGVPALGRLTMACSGSAEDSATGATLSPPGFTTCA